MTTKAEWLVVDGPQAFRSSVRRGEKRHSFQHCEAFLSGGIRENQRVKVLQRQRKRTDDTEPFARDALHRMQNCSRRRSRDVEDS
jgi:hypothetical protein